MLGVRQKVVLIVGADEQPGQALVYAFAQNGANTYFTAKDKRNTDRIIKSVQEKGYSATPIKAGVDGKGLQSALEAVAKERNHIDILVNITPSAKSQKQSEDIVLSINSALPLLKKSRAASIINVAVASKADGKSLGILTEKTARDLMSYGIRSNLITASSVDMEFNPDNHILSGRTLGEKKTNPFDISNMALFLAMDDSFWVNGQRILLDGGLSIIRSS